MPCSARVTNDGSLVHITVKVARFDLHSHKAFRDCYRNENPKAAYTIDLSAAEYIDSSALGMLLLLREFAGGERANITFIGCNEHLRKIFEVTNFYKLFNFIK